VDLCGSETTSQDLIVGPVLKVVERPNEMPMGYDYDERWLIA
jgi:hypothetical protein